MTYIITVTNKGLRVQCATKGEALEVASAHYAMGDDVRWEEA